MNTHVFVGDISFHSGDSYFGANLTNAVHSGAVKEERVTDMAMRIVAAWYKVIFFSVFYRPIARS